MKLAKLVALSCTALSLAMAQAQAAPLKVGIGTESYPPFAVPDANGQYSGWEIDIANEICKQAKLECEIVATAWDGIIPSLVAGKVDIIAASLSITDERSKVIDFSNKYYQSGASLAVAAGSDITPTAESLAGKKIGVQSGSIHQSYVLKHFKDAEIKEYQTQDEANQDLFSGRIDATLADATVLGEFLTTREGELCCSSAGLVKNDEAILGKGIGFGLRKGNDELKAKLDQAIIDIRHNGTYDKITNNYFNFNIYGE
ncbi:transporter substrate-binding domain-containing protein [Vibrio brasiliensis]|jgi:polar amino acid transport system substrate-binding protein|uniref:transporter substrate-binding domain-containing protein n=1 Tax=Vibrio brasiliensis TaxID=170652 RepID=UPI001EFCC1C9|nr:transporter substrate-binding domain-containing protein [Vibrio brasiliensis]MCG9752557.1 transporter substrate-binding domain-containing protein [Vibrio brasiliensis]MCG9782265.1 transporter substrate-binding domain-containing protein [Vibrio brasiliensis]